MGSYNPAVGFHFRVEFDLDGVTDNDFRFQEVSGLTTEVGVEMLDEGGENRFSHRLPGRTKYGNLVLKRGHIDDSALIDWFRAGVEDLDITPTSVIVSLLNDEHMPLTSWAFVNAWPMKFTTSAFNATSNALAVDTIELGYQYLRRV